MLTKLEVSGFKNLHDVEIYFSPFTCIAGENGVGKSNIFDVIEFLSRLADSSFGEAAQSLRSSLSPYGGDGRALGDMRDVFCADGDGGFRDMHLAAEMLVPLTVEDDLGAIKDASTTFLRYELSLAYEAATRSGHPGRIVLRSESLTHITKGEARRHLNFPHSAQKFRSAVVVGQRRGGAFLSTETRDGGLIVAVHGDGGSNGRPQPRAAGRSHRTILSTLTTVENPTALAARREMQSWRRISLEPSAMRSPDSFNSPNSMGSNGAHIAATLYRIAEGYDEGELRDPARVYARISGRMGELLGSRVAGVSVDRDLVRETLTLQLDEGFGRNMPARALSEGTLRFLALCILLEDPLVGGLVCMEEPENGIHPSNLGSMMNLVQDLAVDSSLEPDETNPFRQVIVNTHSPGVVQLCNPEDLVFARVKSGDSGLQVYGYEGSWRTRAGMDEFTRLEALPYLSPPEGIQFELPLDLQ